MQKVLLLEEAPHELSLRNSLGSLGYDVVAHLCDAHALRTEVARIAPDVIIVTAHVPSEATLVNLAAISEHSPLPVVVFAREGSRALIKRAVNCGVAGYVVDGWAEQRVPAIIDAATARFELYEATRSELVKTRTQLLERKVIEKAKGIVMEQRSLSEDEAYTALRRMAMDQNLALAEIARRIISVSELLR
jgi:two-component system, response regulator / RNA-binding antiterminator